MNDLEVTLADLSALSMVDTAFEKSFFPMIEGSEVQNLAGARARLRALKIRLSKYITERDEKTKEKMAEKIESTGKPKDPVKKHGN